MTWTLRFGPAGRVVQVYQGSARSLARTGIDSGKAYRYELVAENRFGDSVGTFGEQTWMAQNLNYRNTTGSSDTDGECYGGSIDSCTKYGRFYQPPEDISNFVPSRIQGVCPEGWHLPSDGDVCYRAVRGFLSDAEGVNRGIRFRSASPVRCVRN